MMADGTIVIGVEFDEHGAVKGVEGLDNKLGGAGKTAKGTGKSVKDIALGVGAFAVVNKGIDMMKNSLGGAIDRYDTLNQFPRVLESMGFDAQDSERAINDLSAGVQGLPTKLDTVAKTAQGIAVMTGDLDGAVDTTLALNNAFLSSGASTADAERGLKQYTQMLAKGKVDLQSWYTLQETMGPALQEVAEAFGFAGASAQNDLFDALQSGSITFDEFNQKLIESDQKVGGFAERAKEGSKGVKTSMQNIKTAFEIGIANIMDKINEVVGGTDVFADALDYVKDKVHQAFGVAEVVVGAFAHALKLVLKVAQPLAPILEAIAVAIMAYIAIDSVTSKITGLITSFKNLGSTIKILHGALMANPWMLIASLAVAAVYLIVTNWDLVGDFFKGLWTTIKDLAYLAWEGVKHTWSEAVEFFSGVWDKTKEATAQTWEDIKNILSTVWDAIKDIASFVWENMKYVILGPIIGLALLIKENWEEIKEFLSFLWESIKELASLAWEGIKLVIIEPIQALAESIVEIWNTITDFLSTVWEGIKELASTMWNAIKDAILFIIESLIDFYVNYFNFMRDTAETIWNFISGLAKTIWNGIKDTISKAIQLAVDYVQGQWQKLKDLTSQVWNFIKNTVSRLANGMKDGAVRAFTSLWNKTKELFNKVKDAITKPLEGINLFQIGKDIVSGLINGLNNMFDKVKETVSNMAGAIKDGFKGAMQIFSPSRVFYGYAEDIVAGVTTGIEDNEKYAVNEVEDLADGMKGKFSSELTDIVDTDKLKAFANIGLNNVATSDVVPVNNTKNTNTTKQHTNNSNTIIIEKMEVRNDEDIVKISRELRRLQDRTDKFKGKGGVPTIG